MNLTPQQPAGGAKGVTVRMRRRAGRVWLYLLSVARATTPPTLRFQVSRREIQSGTGIGSLNTVDSALEDLEAFGVIQRHPEPGSNDGMQYELVTLDECPSRLIDPALIASDLRQAASYVEEAGPGLTDDELLKCLELTHRARQFMSEHARSHY